MENLTFAVGWGEVVHEVAEEIIQLHRTEEGSSTGACEKWTGRWAEVFHLDLGLFSGVFDGLEDVPGASPSHLRAGDVLTIPSLNQDSSSDGCNTERRSQTEVVKCLKYWNSKKSGKISA